MKGQWMKPCICNGGNENCCYCFGSGYVPDKAPLPKPPTPRPPIPVSSVEKETAPPVFVKRPTDWKEIIRGILALFFPFVLWFVFWFLRWLWRNL
jgi:hypothetical protein